MGNLRFPVKRAFWCLVTERHFAVDDTYQTDDPERIVFLQQEGFLASEVEEAADEDQDEDDESEVYPKHVGGGTWLLSNGEKLKGKDAALEAQKALDEATEE